MVNKSATYRQFVTIYLKEKQVSNDSIYIFDKIKQVGILQNFEKRHITHSLFSKCIIYFYQAKWNTRHKKISI